MWPGGQLELSFDPWLKTFLRQIGQSLELVETTTMTGHSVSNVVLWSLKSLNIYPRSQAPFLGQAVRTGPQDLPVL